MSPAPLVPVPVPVEVEGGTLATFRYGDPDAPPHRTVVALHGITASSRAWPAVVRAAAVLSAAVAAVLTISSLDRSWLEREDALPVVLHADH